VEGLAENSLITGNEIILGGSGEVGVLLHEKKTIFQITK